MRTEQEIITAIQTLEILKNLELTDEEKCETFRKTLEWVLNKKNRG